MEPGIVVPNDWSTLQYDPVGARTMYALVRPIAERKGRRAGLEPDDLTQEILLRFVRAKLSNCKGGAAGLERWANIVATHIIADRHRSKKRKPETLQNSETLDWMAGGASPTQLVAVVVSELTDDELELMRQFGEGGANAAASARGVSVRHANRLRQSVMFKL